MELETEVEATADHNTKLRQFVQRCRERGLKLLCNEIPYMGHLVTARRLRPYATCPSSIMSSLVAILWVCELPCQIPASAGGGVRTYTAVDTQGSTMAVAT